MSKDGGVSRQLPHRSAFVSSNVIIYMTIIRLALIFELLPDEIASLLHLASVRSTVVRTRETPRYLKVAASFRDLFSTFSQAYHVSPSSPLPLVLAAYLALQKCMSPIPDFWCRVMWRLCLLLVDLMISRTMERISLFIIKAEKGDREEGLQTKMSAAIQPPRGHIFQITSSLKDAETETLLATAHVPVLAAQLYYASPITFLASGLYDSFQNVWCLFLLWSIHEVMFSSKKAISLTALSLALAAYGQPWYMAFCVPIMIWQPSRKKAGIFLMLFLLCVLWLQGLSFLLLGTKAYWTWKPILQLTPNLGPLWYFQMQLFDRFRDFFHIMITGLPYLTVAPLTIRLHRYPIALITCLWFIGMLFHRNPTLYDFNVALCLMIMSPRSLARMNTVSFIALSSIAVPVSLYTLDYGLWLETGSGNANYIFFQCLAYNVFVATIFLDFLGATLQRDKALRLTEKVKRETKEQEQT